MTVDAYNPLEKGNLGRSVAATLLNRPIRQLADTDGLVGAGVYAIYYTGPFKPYRPITKANTEGGFAQPIYVGKAIPKGGRKGGLTNDASSTGTALRSRLNQHAKSINECGNLALADFHYRALVVDDIWIPLGENMLIEMFMPVWNRVIDGFGNKDPGARRAAQFKSPWDTLHPGREHAKKLAEGTLTEKALRERLAAYFAGRPVPLIEPTASDEDS